MKESLILFIFILVSTNSYSQSSIFPCPVKKGKIEVYNSDNEVDLKPGTTFRSNHSTVYNIAEGVITSIDTVSGLINVYVISGDFFFSYHGFESIWVSKNQKLNAGERIGSLKKNEKLFLIMSFRNTLVDPVKYLRCKTVEVWL